MYRLIRPPRALRGIPQVPVWRLCISYLLGEIEEKRTKRILLPFALRNHTDVILVWLKQQPPQRMLFWRFIGKENIFVSEGEQWQKHSRIFKAAIQRTAPMEQFTYLCKKVCTLIGDGGRVRFNNIAHCFTLDAVGTTVIGHNFEALDKPGGSFIRHYRRVMAAIADPLYVFIPVMEKWLPRHAIRRDVDALVDRFHALLSEKKGDPGNDMLTFMLEEPNMTDTELRDNAIVIFMGGHDSTAGAISSLILLLGLHTAVQDRARAEILSILRAGEEIRAEHFANMPYLHAVIKEAMRFNPSSNFTLPRVADVPVQVGHHLLPPSTPVILNLCAIMHNECLWDSPSVFNPDRFLNDGEALKDDNWFPFGHGPRQCPARNFALLEQRMIAISLLREYTWSVPKDSIHSNGIRNAFSTFSLSLPFDVDIEFTKI
ncbi:cytochrome P450 [Wolfiporia cocos MD-104 SS10]|uniref:Cytochrome P450 n=1 Tax=Wolfiporia cocos (strain MD-104) TaxID=742152 RepID=A0A2H3JVU4_WOLCO|nr:cytochrome P450 [Wolfiporia cocos MD-104 SS10]